LTGATNDHDAWVNISPENAARINRALRQFGFAAAQLTCGLFLVRNNVVRMGVPPISKDLNNKAASGRAKDLADLENLPE
jgi:hypothetical protein